MSSPIKRAAIVEHNRNAAAALAAAVDVDELTKVLERTKWETRFPKPGEAALAAPTSRQLAEAVRGYLLGASVSRAPDQGGALG